MKFPTIKARTVVFWGLLFFYSFFIVNHFFVSYKEGATDMHSMSPGTDASNNSMPAKDASIHMVDPSKNVVTPDLSGELLSLKKKEEKMKHDLDDLQKQIHKLETPSSA
jgi:TolA-binding protein